VKIAKIFRTIRIQTLGCALAPVLCSGWLAYQEFGFRDWWIWMMTGFFAVNLQIAANCFDDHFDEGTHLTLALVSLGLAVSTAAVTIFLTQTWVLLPFGLLCILSLLFYSGGPRPLGDSGWGEALVFLFFGPICGCGSFYIFTKQFDWRIIAMSLVLGLVIVGLLVFNHFEDFLKDLKAGSSTFATSRILKQLSQLEQEKN
jgi:1,4-dihydroxy-2-naphthoate octaprenyltransferase